MFNYKRLTFIFILLSLLLTVSDTAMEKQAKKSLLSFVNIVVEEGSEVGENAPGSFLDSMESGRISLYNFLDRQANTMSDKSKNAKNFFAAIFSILYYLFVFMKFLCGYVITFYPSIIFLLYLFFTSRFFKRNDYYDSYYGSY
jgi:predicted PurR-regulated permease PerM